MPYPYPPSEHIRRYGYLQENTHFFCDGVMYSEEGWGTYDDRTKVTKIRCKFEVVYTQSCKVFVICYLELGNLTPNKHKKPITYPNFSANCKWIIGRDVRTGFNVFVEYLNELNLSSRTTSNPVTTSSEFRIEYSAVRFTVGLPLRRREIAVESDENFDLTQQGYDPHFEITGLELYNTDQPLYFPLLKDGENTFLTLLGKRTYSELEFDNQTTAELIIPQNCIPDGWTALEIVDVWCALASLAMGRDIQWTSWFFPFNYYSYYQQRTWKTRKIHGKKPFHAYVAHRGDFTELSQFIHQCFNMIMIGKMSSNDALIYVRIFRQYVYYVTVGLGDVESTARLVTTLTEEFLNTWFKISQTPSQDLMTRQERNTLIGIIEDVLENRKDEFLGALNRQNFSLIRNKVVDLIQREARKDDFAYKMQRYFQANRGNEELDKELTDRIAGFIKTRNSIIHIGRLWHYNEEFDESKLESFYNKNDDTVAQEYRNALLIMPLMMMSLFGYHDSYRRPDGYV